jgi:hypothetical protein
LNYYDLDAKNREIFFQKFYSILYNYSKIYDFYKYENIAEEMRLKI